MSEIPFVDRLGDAVERAAAQRIATRGRRLRRRLSAGAIGLALLGGGAAAASGVFSDPERLATNSVACYEEASLDTNVSVQSTGEDTPVETCARVLRTDEPLVACAADGAVAVFPGRGAQVCDRLGLVPLPAGYDAARARVTAFSRAVMAMERSEACIAPAELARRVQGLLDRSGWAGWRTVVRDDLGSGPCAEVSSRGGDGRRSIEGSLVEGQVLVVPVPASAAPGAPDR